MRKLFVLTWAIVLTSRALVFAQQEEDTTLRKNTIKLDITSYWLYRNAAMFSLERVAARHPYQTWSVTAGFQQFPEMVGTILDTVNVTRDSNASGYKVGGEYRFYLKKENRFKAPHGVYLGPYANFHHYSNSRSLEVDNNGVMEFADLNTQLNILNIGFQLGYQFLFSNRWTIDLIFVGPSVSYYSLKSSMEGNYTFNADDVTNQVWRALIDRYPAFGRLIDEGEMINTGKMSRWGYGYRYQLHVGYHFGRKKK